jgi:hypothetical protein
MKWPASYWKERFARSSRPRRTGPGDGKMLEMGEARVLLTTWEATKDKKLLERHLKRAEKLYGPGAAERVRKYMRWIADNERPK